MLRVQTIHTFYFTLRSTSGYKPARKSMKRICSVLITKQEYVQIWRLLAALLGTLLWKSYYILLAFCVVFHGNPFRVILVTNNPPPCLVLDSPILSLYLLCFCFLALTPLSRVWQFLTTARCLRQSTVSPDWSLVCNYDKIGFRYGVFGSVTTSLQAIRLGLLVEFLRMRGMKRLVTTLSTLVVNYLMISGRICAKSCIHAVGLYLKNTFVISR